MAQVRVILSSFGGKCEKLAKQPCLCTLAYAALARYIKMNRLLATQRTLRSTERLKLEGTSAKLRERQTDLEHQLSDFSARVHSLESQLAELNRRSAQREDLVEKMTKRCNVAETMVEMLKVKVATSEKKVIRSKAISSRFFHEKQDLIAELKVVRNESVARLNQGRSCCVCFEIRALVVFFPCGHAAVCVHCSIDMATCPMCNNAVKDRTQLFCCDVC